METIEQLELNNVDSDIREAYLPYIGGRYRTGEPTEIQIVRLLRQVNENLVKLLEIFKVCNKDSNTSS